MAGLLTLMTPSPILPLRGLIRLAEILRDQAAQELHDPSAVRRQLEEAAEAADSGLLSDEEVSRVQAEAVGRLIQRPGTVSTKPTGEQ